MLEDDSDDFVCRCPLCHHQPLHLHMGWFMCVCGFRLNIKHEPITMRQLHNAIQHSASMHASRGCSAGPHCCLKVSINCGVWKFVFCTFTHSYQFWCLEIRFLYIYTQLGTFWHSILGDDLRYLCFHEHNCLNSISIFLFRQMHTFREVCWIL